MGGRKRGSQILTPLELQIMQVLWEHGPGNVQDVQQRLSAEPGLAYTTVQTMLNVLLRKGKVKRSLRGRAYEYRSAVSKDKAVGQAVRDFVERMFGGSSEDLVMSLMKARQIDLNRIAELAQRLDAAEGGDR